MTTKKNTKKAAPVRTRAQAEVHTLEPDIQLGDRAYQQIKSDIVRCILRPGSEVSETRLCERYDLGKAPIRNALARLRHQGLVSSRARRGYIVAPITVRAVRELFRVRLVLEPEAARLAAGRVDGDLLLALEAEVARGYTPGDHDSERRWYEANRRFHMAIAEAAGNDRLAVLINELLDDMLRVLYLSSPYTAHDSPIKLDRRELIRALVSGDAEESARVMHEEIEAGERIVMGLLLSNPGLLETAIVEAS
jgi:DNA-binding GntR family transcriptional regulator